MTKAYTANFKELTGSTSGEEPVFLLEINHAQLASPIRLANDTQDLVSNGETFFACAFDVSLPDDIARTMPTAELSLDNIGRELVAWLEGSNGGKGAQVRMMQVMRGTPDIIESDYTLDLLGVKQNMLQIVGQLGFENLFDIPGLAATYTPDLIPGIF